MPTETLAMMILLLEAATTINLPKQIDQAADDLINRLSGEVVRYRCIDGGVRKADYSEGARWIYMNGYPALQKIQTEVYQSGVIPPNRAYWLCEHRDK